MTLFNPPTIGSSQNIAYLEGFGLVTSPPGSPPNFGWEISEMPEPSTLVLLLGSAIMALAGLGRKGIPLMV